MAEAVKVEKFVAEGWDAFVPYEPKDRPLLPFEGMVLTEVTRYEFYVAASKNLCVYTYHKVDASEGEDVAGLVLTMNTVVGGTDKNGNPNHVRLAGLVEACGMPLEDVRKFAGKQIDPTKLLDKAVVGKKCAISIKNAMTQPRDGGDGYEFSDVNGPVSMKTYQENKEAGTLRRRKPSERTGAPAASAAGGKGKGAAPAKAAEAKTETKTAASEDVDDLFA